MATHLYGFTRRLMPSIRVLAFFIMFFSLISLVVFYNFPSTEQSPEWARQQNRLVGNIEDIDDYDAACSGYSFGRILREQKRILASVRQELAESQQKIEEIRAVQGELHKLIPQKQLELSALEGEIEAAQRQLEELRETQNVKVFLPYSPIDILRNPYSLSPESSRMVFDDFFDYSRCSITSFMPIYIGKITSGIVEEEWKAVFEEVALNLVETPDEACISIWITNGVVSERQFKNSLLFNVGESLKDSTLNAIVAQKSMNRLLDYAIHVNTTFVSKPIPIPLLPLSRDNLITLIIRDNEQSLDVKNLEVVEKVIVRRCSQDDCSQIERERLFKSSVFCFLIPSDEFLEDFMYSLQHGCIPVIFSNTEVLPFQEIIDWRLASYRISMARLPEAHFIVRSFEFSDVLEMRRMGKNFYEEYLSSRTSVARTLIAALRYKLQIPTRETRSSQRNRAVPLFNSSFISPIGSTVNAQPNYDDEYLLGPLEPPVESSPFLYNFTEFQMYSYESWNKLFSPYRSKEYIINSAEAPAESEFNEDTKIGFRPIEPGSGIEFNKALGGNRQREQFTIVILTYERDSILTRQLERLHQLPYLNKIIVVWNSFHRDPPTTWPSLHVPVEFIRVEKNSLNNRFVPWDRIETEAVLSLDDDIDLLQQEYILAFRVWRENRDRIVGFPARYHARYGDEMFYNSNHTCQMSMILTGAAFLHKNYLSAYTHQMPSAIRDHVDSVQNCEDIAMNFLVSHLSRKPPIKTTSRWTLKCPTCSESLFKEDSHFNKRHECIRLFTKIYGYNPLRFTQYRVDSILFKTRLPQNHQKCFKVV